MSNHPLTLILRFSLEIAALVAYGVWGWHVGSGFWRIALVIALPWLAAILWGLFVSPKAAIAAPGIVRLAVEALIFGGAVWAVYAAGWPQAALILAALIIVQEAAGYDRIIRLISG